MNERLLLLETLLKNKNPQLIQHLIEGTPNDITITFFKSFLLLANTDDNLCSLYNWHNGTRLNEENHCLNFCLFPDYIFMSLDNIKETIDTDCFYNFRSEKMMPILSSTGGDFLSFKIEEYNQSDKDCKIYYCSPRVTNAKNIISMFDSFNSMIECVIKSYENSFYFINQEDNIMDEDFEQVQNLFKKLNPKSDYWSSNEIV